jgi:hypothetical protein
LHAEKLGIVCRAAEDGSLGWKFLLQHVADDAKALPAISRARRGAMSQAPETTRFGKGAAARRLRALRCPRALARVRWSPRLPCVADPAQPMAGRLSARVLSAW